MSYDKNEYKMGFESGYRLVEKNKQVPSPTHLSSVPHGSTALREGIKAGIKKAGAIIAKPID